MVSRSWFDTLKEDAEIKLTWDKMMKVRTFFSKSSDKAVLLPKKLPKDNPTRPWCGLADFFDAYMNSFDTISNIVADKIDAPTDRSLISKLASAFSEFSSIFKSMEAANNPTLHLVIISYVEINSFISNWPEKLYTFENNVRKCDF